MAEERILEFFGDTQIREEVLDLMGLGSCMPREAWRLPRLPSPKMLQNSFEAFTGRATSATSKLSLACTTPIP